MAIPVFVAVRRIGAAFRVDSQNDQGAVVPTAAPGRTLGFVGTCVVGRGVQCPGLTPLIIQRISVKECKLFTLLAVLC